MEKKARTTNMHIRVNPEIKEKAMEILDDIGISASDIFNMLLHQITIQQKVPFELVSNKYICSYGYQHDYSDIQPPDEEEYVVFESWDKAKEWINA